MEIKHRAQLGELIKHCQVQMVAAELGCAEGFFSKDLLSMGLNKLYMVDNWGTIDGVTGDGNSPQDWHDKNYRDAISRVGIFEDKFEILRGLTHEMAKYVKDGSLGLLYIDACHTYEAVFKDLSIWYDKVQVGGIIAGHDYLNPSYGVKPAVHDFVNGRFEIHTIEENHRDDAGFWFIKQ